jgi:ketol-acid reductoisomerase
MKQLLSNIQDGSFAAKFINENKTGRHGFAKYREAERNHPIEKVGSGLRASMPFLDPLKIVDGVPVKA